MTTIPPPRGEVVIVGVGARTHSGLTALQVAMSVRAAKFRPELCHMVDRFGERIGLCRLMSIGDNVFGVERLAAIAGPALVQATHPWIARERLRGSAASPLPVVLAVADEARAATVPHLARDLLKAIEERSSVAIDHRRSVLVSHCRAGGGEAIRIALDRLRTRQDEAIAVGGVDSYFDPAVLERLDREFRLHSLNCENGFVPGEGAAFLLLTTRSQATSLHRFGQIIAAEHELEPRPYGSPDPCQGLGMTAAVKKAVGSVGAKARRIDWVLTDVANERHRVDEWQYAAARNHEAFTRDYLQDQALLRTGDLGSASAATLLVIACMNWQTGAARSGLALVAMHSDGPHRSVVVAAEEAA